VCLLAGATGLVLLAILMLPADQPQSSPLAGGRPLRTEAAPQVRVAPDALLGWQSRLLSADSASPASDVAGLVSGEPQSTLPPAPTATPVLEPTVAPPVLAPTESAPAPTPESVEAPVVATSCPPAALEGSAVALFDAVNGERTQHGLPALAADGCVTYLAGLRAADMASRDYFSHTTPENETAFTLLGRYGVAYGAAAENLVRNNYPDDETVTVAVQGLMESERHRASVLNGSYTHVGVATAVDEAGMKYYVMIFIEAAG
jgi:uncharacterized protein YkwD